MGPAPHFPAPCTNMAPRVRLSRGCAPQTLRKISELHVHTIRCTMHNAFAWQSRRGVQRYCGVQRCDTVQRCGTQCDGRGGAWCCREELRAMQSKRTFPMVSSFCLQVAETHAVAIKKTGLIRTFCALKLIPVPVG